LTDEKLLHTIGSANLGDFLDDVGVVVAAIATDDEKGVLSALGDGEDDAGNKRLGIVLLLEDFDLFAQTRAAETLACHDQKRRKGIDVRSGLLVAEGRDGNGLDRHGGVAGALLRDVGREEKEKGKGGKTKQGRTSR
jgi:hypothetical protein